MDLRTLVGSSYCLGNVTNTELRAISVSSLLFTLSDLISWCFLLYLRLLIPLICTILLALANNEAILDMISVYHIGALSL
jgi:hypothetical protein